MQHLRASCYLGDVAYCYQGLQRRRPIVDGTDTEFEAFVKLSLANDSSRLFERMLCMLPKRNDHFFTQDDYWGADLWDIEPTCQVAGVDRNSVLIDGCRGAKIRWKGFKRVAYANRDGWKRFFASLVLRFNLWGLLGFSIGALFIPLLGVFTFLSLVAWFATPHLVRVLYGGKVWGTQAWLFGFEGYMDIATIEAMIFGNNEKRLSWATASSNLSRHGEDATGACIGLDPMSDIANQEILRNAYSNANLNGEKVFTLVDTHTMTVTMFTARQPPTALLVCGVEGGMHRAVLCSYDWTTGTLYRESVIRMETQALNCLDRVARLKFGFMRPNTAPQ